MGEILKATEMLDDQKKKWLDWLKKEKNLSALTVQVYLRVIEEFLLFLTHHQGEVISTDTLKSLKAKDFRAWMMHLLSEKIKRNHLSAALFLLYAVSSYF